MFYVKYELSLSFVGIDVLLEVLQAVTIRRAEEKGTSISLLAKLHHGVAEFLDEAAVILYAAIGECKDISSRFVVCRNFLTILFSIVSTYLLMENQLYI